MKRNTKDHVNGINNAYTRKNNIKTAKPATMIFTKESVRIFNSLNKLISGTDIVLFLLYAGDVRGKTILQNQVFIAWKEIFFKRSIDLGYQPNPDGVYSQSVEDFAVSLEHESLISVIKIGRRVTYTITERGIENVKTRTAKLKVDLSRLLEKKQDWDEWDKDGIMRYVARKHPKYVSDFKSFVPTCTQG